MGRESGANLAKKTGWGLGRISWVALWESFLVNRKRGPGLAQKAQSEFKKFRLFNNFSFLNQMHFQEHRNGRLLRKLAP